MQTLQIGLVFCFAFKCFFSQCDFYVLAGGCLFGRQTQSGTLHLAHPAYPQNSHKPSPLGSFYLAFAVAFVFGIEGGKASEGSCAVSSSPLPTGAQCGLGDAGRLQL